MLENGQNQANQLQALIWAKDDPQKKKELIRE